MHVTAVAAGRWSMPPDSKSLSAVAKANLGCDMTQRMAVSTALSSDHRREGEPEGEP